MTWCEITIVSSYCRENTRTVHIFCHIFVVSNSLHHQHKFRIRFRSAWRTWSASDRARLCRRFWASTWGLRPSAFYSPYSASSLTLFLFTLLSSIRNRFCFIRSNQTTYQYHFVFFSFSMLFSQELSYFPFSVYLHYSKAPISSYTQIRRCVEVSTSIEERSLPFFHDSLRSPSKCERPARVCWSAHQRGAFTALSCISTTCKPFNHSFIILHWLQSTRLSWLLSL